MGCFERILILLLSISGILSDTASRSVGTRELLNDELLRGESIVRAADANTKCVAQCSHGYHRVCYDDELPMPLACGGCMHGHTERRVRDGVRVCLHDDTEQQRQQSKQVQEAEPEIDRLVDMIESQRQREAQDNKINAAEPIGKHKLHRMLQKVQQKLHGNGKDDLHDNPEEYPSLGDQLGYVPDSPNIDTYQATGDRDDKHSGYHSNQEMVGYQKEGESEDSVEEHDDISSSSEEEEEKQEKEVVHQHPRPPQHLKSPKDGEVLPGDKVSSMADVYFLAVVAGCSVAGVVGLIVAGVCWYRLQKNVKAASEAEYSAYGVTGPQQEEPQQHMASPGDRKLAQSAQMYHYQHQKQQMLAMEKANGDMTKDDEGDSEEENEEGDYTVYECPGLAPTGEMEVKNPLFSEDTPVTPSDGKEERQ